MSKGSGVPAHRCDKVDNLPLLMSHGLALLNLVQTQYVPKIAIFFANHVRNGIIIEQTGTW